MIWSSPLQITIAVIILWKHIGVAAIAGLATMIAFIPFNAFFTSKNYKIKKTRLKYQDIRIKMLNEILSGIRVIKFYGWEESFRKLIANIRKIELVYFKRSEFTGLLGDCLWEASPFIVSAVSFTTYVLIDEKNKLDPYKAFISLSLFDLIRFPLVMLPMVLSGLSDVILRKLYWHLKKREINMFYNLKLKALVSLKRINSYLMKEDQETNVVESIEDIGKC